MAKPLMAKFYPFDVVDLGFYVVNLVLDIGRAGSVVRGVIDGK